MQFPTQQFLNNFYVGNELYNSFFSDYYNGLNNSAEKSTGTRRTTRRTDYACNFSFTETAETIRAESDARMGRVTRGKDSFWWYFSVDRFPVMDLSPGPTPATLNRNCWCRWFYTYSRRFTHVFLRVSSIETQKECICGRQWVRQ